MSLICPNLAQPAENILSEIKTDPTKPNVNTEKLARRVFEILKDRLHLEIDVISRILAFSNE